MPDADKATKSKTAPDNVQRYLWLGGEVVALLCVAGIVVYWMWFVPVSVVRHTAGPQEIVVEVMGTGTLEAHVKATISTKIPGRLKVVSVDQGDTVNEGQTLARLDEHDLGHEVEVEEATVAVRKAAIERFQAGVAQSQAVFAQASANEARIRRLVSMNAISQEDLEKAVEALGIAGAGATRAEAELLEAKRQLITAEKTLEFRRARLGDAEIKAPFDGVVVRRDRNAGDVVVPGSSIFAVVATNELWVNAWVDESAMAAVRAAQPARVVFRSRPGESVAGTVVRTGRETDRETREFLVDVAPKKVPEDWSVGQRAEVYIETARKKAGVVIPAEYIVWHDRKPLAFVEVDGRAVQRAVMLGLRSRDTVEILEGITAEEVVLVPVKSGTKLADGQRIHQP